MSSSSRSTSARRSSRGPSNTCVLTARRGPAKGCSTSRKDRAPDELGIRGGQPDLLRPSPTRTVSPAWRGETFGKSHPREDEQARPRSRPGDAISKSHPGRACAQKEPSGSFSYLSEIHLVELFDASDVPPAPHQRGGACGLA